MLGDNKFQCYQGCLGFLGFLGMQGFSLHNPLYLFGFCFSAFFFAFKSAPGKWSNLKYLGLLSVAGFIVSILGVLGVILV